MQLSLGPDPRTDILLQLQTALIERFGQNIRTSGKRRDPVWTLVQGVIGALTKTPVSNAATDQVLETFGSWEAVAGTPLDELTAILGRQTFPEQSARRLKDCLSAIIAQRGAADLRHLSNLETSEAMDWLETLPGVGRKIAAGVMNTSIFARRTLVIDSHHRRIMQRMGLVPPKANTARVYDALMPVMPQDWSAAQIDEHHLLVKTLGQQICRPTSPRCDICPVQDICEFDQAKRKR